MLSGHPADRTIGARVRTRSRSTVSLSVCLSFFPLEKVRVNLGLFMNLHLLQSNKSEKPLSYNVGRLTHHLECVELLLNLLRQQRRKLVTRRHLATPVVLAARPRVVKHELRRKRRAALHRPVRRRRRQQWCAPSVLPQPHRRHKVVLVANRHRVGALLVLLPLGRRLGPLVVIRGARNVVRGQVGARSWQRNKLRQTSRIGFGATGAG